MSIRILTLVPNGGTNDARVVREAESLQRANFKIVICARIEDGAEISEARTPENVRVHRVDGSVRAARHARAAYYCILVATCVLAVLAYSLILHGPMWNLITGGERIIGVALQGVGWPQSFDPFTKRVEKNSLAYHAANLSLLVLLAYAAVFALTRLLDFNEPGGTTGQGPSRIAGSAARHQGFIKMWRALAKSLLDRGALNQVRSWLLTYFAMRSQIDAMLRFAIDYRPDIVQCHEVGTLEVGARLQSKIGCQVVYEAHEIYDDLASASAALSLAYRRIHRKFIRRIDAMITINKKMSEFYCEKYPFLPTPVIIPNSVYPAVNKPYDGRLHEAAGLPNTEKIALFQGLLSPGRGLRQLVEAAYHLQPGWCVVFMGDGYLREELIRLSDELRARSTDKVHKRGSDDDLDQKVCFVPKAPHRDLVHWTRGATVGMIPYENVSLNHWYCSPNKIWEFPNAGVPIVGSRLAYLGYVVERYQIGWTISAHPTAKEISNLLNSLDANDLARKRNACAAFVESDNYVLHEKCLIELFARLSRKAEKKRESVGE